MNIDEATAILREFILPDGGLSHGVQYIWWEPGDTAVELDAHFGIEELEAITVYVKHHNPTRDSVITPLAKDNI